MRQLASLLLGLLLGLPAAADAQRVVSLAPSLTEIMLELGAGAQLAGVLDGAPRPPQIAQLPSLGRYGQLDIETLIGLNPDLILLWPDSIPPAQRAQLDRLGIATIVAEPRSLEELAGQLELIGAAVGHAGRGRQLASELRAGMAELQARYAGRPPLRLFYQVWDQPLYTLGGTQIINDALRLCGAQNVFADLSLPAPQVSIEAVLARDPDLILVGPPHRRLDWQAWPQLRAVREGRVLVLPDEGIERPSFQMLQATRKLCAALDRLR